MMPKINKNTVGWIVAAIIIIVIGGLFFAKEVIGPTLSSQQETKDEFTGSWRGGGTMEDGQEWFVIYTFKNGTYDMKTDSDVVDNGTYLISERYEDGSIQMTKTSILFNKTFDVINKFEDDGKTLIIEGMKLKKE